MRFSYSSGSKPLEGYTIKRGIGIGGFGEVYFALNDAGKEVALKKIQRNLDIELRGVRHCLNLKHVNLISLWDIRSNEYGESWVVMEYVPGPSLRDVVESYPQGMPEDQIKRWFASTASGVAYLHEHGIVHRDLKPGNIFHDQDEQVIKIGDYGLSKFISCSRRSGQTESVGTFHYMAPEIGKGEYGKEIDVYAMGIILYEMLTGQVPFDGESTQEIIMKHLTMDPDVDIVPTAYKRVIAKALRKDPQRRFSNISSMVRELPWPEIASGHKDIIGRHAVGPIRLEDEPDASKVSTAEHPGSPENDNVGSPASVFQDGNVAKADIVSKLPPVIISGNEIEPVTDAEIKMGPLRDSSHRSQKPMVPGGEVTDREIQFIDSAEVPVESKADLAGRVTSREAEANDMRLKLTNPGDEAPTELVAAESATLAANVVAGEASANPDEPIALAVRSGLSDINRWWNNANVSTPVRLGLLVVVGIVVVQNSAWLLPVVLGLATVYLLYFAARRYVLTSSAGAKGPSIRQRRGEQETMVRQWIAARPPTDRMTELVGSMLVGAVGAVALSLVGMAIRGSSSMQMWAVFTWQTLICVAAVWTVLVVTKSWSLKRGEHLFRMGMITLAGAVLGAVAFFSASSFEIDLARVATDDFAANGTVDWVVKGLPKLPALMIAFAGLFGLARFGGHTDPIRRTRLSVMNVVLCLMIAAVLSHLLNVPLTVMCIWATVISVASQLASPWMHPDEQMEVCRQAE